MLRVLKLMSCLGVGCLGLLGCTQTPKRAVIRPPKEEFHAPPDGLFKGRVEYPNEMLNNVAPRRKKDDDKFTPPPGPLGGGGMSGPGIGASGQ